jgi:hypothetical protein
LTVVILLSSLQPQGPYANLISSRALTIIFSVILAILVEILVQRKFSATPLLIVCSTLIIVNIIFFAPPEFNAPRTSDLAIDKRNPAKTSVVWIVADEVGANMVLTREGKIRNELQTLGTLSKESNVYRRAVTTFTKTVSAVPAMLNGVVSGTPETQLLNDKWGVFPKNDLAGNRFYYSPAGPTPCGMQLTAIILDCDSRGGKLKTFLKRQEVLFFDLLAHALWNSFIPARNNLQQLTFLQLDFFERLSRDSSDVADLASFIVSQETGQPFFAFYHSLETHSPWNLDRYKNIIWKDDGEIAGAGNFDSPALTELREQIRFESVVRFDRQLKHVIGALKNSGHYESTMIIITSDHGSQFGQGQINENSRWSVSNRDTLRNVANVPLIVKFPYQKDEAIVDDIVVVGQVANQVASMFGMKIDRLTHPTLIDSRPIGSRVALVGADGEVTESIDHSLLELLDFDEMDLDSNFIANPGKGIQRKQNALQIDVIDSTWYGVDKNTPQLVRIRVRNDVDLKDCLEFQVFEIEGNRAVGTVFRSESSSSPTTATLLGITERAIDRVSVICGSKK